jgi:dihydrofolate reductase
VAVFGSSDLTVSLIEMGLVDELRLMVHPIILGAGKSLFRTAERRIGLELLKVRPFKSGNVMLHYRPVAP